ncbi:MAG TPA: heme biosynthesis HemY N-terminal domain-containing protein [Gammaproteobacteria bacterium]|nr:heme biosynthesis HemY N-terminal domain-containing protein [Gammaproteobacteria bacterium]
MKRAIGLVIVLAVATLIGVALQADNGYALFSYRGTTVEMSLVALALFCILAFIVVYVLVRFGIRFARLTRGAGERRKDRRQRRANQTFISGLIDVSEGRWEKGEREVMRAADGSDTTLLNYLVAARAAQEQGADERRDEYLHKAYELSDKSRMAVLLTQADLQIAHRQFELALATLRRVQELKPHHSYALRLLARLYRELGDYEQLHSLLDSLRNYHALPAARIDEIELDTVAILMNAAAEARDATRLDKLWQGMAKHLRARPAATHAYARALIQAEAGEAAESFIRAQLKASWDDELARCYGLIPNGDPAKRLARAEGWLNQHGDSAELLLSLGRLAIACELWGNARTYLENSVRHGKRADAWIELGRLLESLDEQPAAAEAYKAALALTADMPATPAPRALPLAAAAE